MLVNKRMESLCCVVGIYVYSIYMFILLAHWPYTTTIIHGSIRIEAICCEAKANISRF